MTLAIVSLTNTCNFKCRTCDIGQNNKESSGLLSNWIDNIDHDLLEIDEWVSIFNNIKATTIHLMGVEPLLYPNFGELLTRIKSNRKIMITTNGWFIDRYMDSIISNCDNIAISLDGLKETNDYIRGMDGAFDRAFSAIKFLKKNDVNVRVSYTINSDSIDDIIPFYQFLYENHKVPIYFNHYNYIHKDSCYGTKCSPSNLKFYNPQEFNLTKILKAIDYCKNAYFLPNLNSRQVKTYYKDIPSSYKKVKHGCFVLEGFLNGSRFAISSNGDFILPGRCWYNIGYMGNALKGDFNPKNCIEIKKIVSNINKKGFPPPCQRLCCAGNII